MKSYKNIPFKEAHEQAQALINKGHTIWQRWTCDYCGARQTMEKPNLFYIAGICEECNRVTNINECGFSAAFSVRK